MKTFKNKVVVITGAGSGIGRALAQSFAKEGARLALNDYNSDSLAETAQMLKSSQASIFQSAFDVSDKAAMFDFAEQVIAEFGQVDIMINNAGVALGDYAFDQIDLDMFERVMDVNFNGVLYGSKAFIPYLLKRQEAALVNVSSIFGLAGIAMSSAYCSSKFAVHGLTQSLIQEHQKSVLTVHSVHPGGIDTNITRNAIDYKEIHEKFHKEFLKRSPISAAQTIIKGIRKRRTRILIGGEAHQLDVMVRILPVLGVKLVNNIIRRKINAILKK